MGHYVLHTGRTEEATLTRGDDQDVISYRRLVEPVTVACCPACFASPAMRRLWASFGGPDGPAS